MSRRRSSGGSRPPADRQRPKAADPKPSLKDDPRARIGLLIGTLILIAVVVIGTDFVLGAISGQAAAPSAATSASPTPFGVLVPGDNGGHWTNVSPDQLAQMLENKDFTLLNVKTPYSNEIDRTDLYIPYNQLSTRASELPPNKGAKILVYCLTGHSSAIAAQTLLDLGYTNVWNLDGGMNAWIASGRTLVNKNR
jgi:rhodanese-related sulfurtransferase